MNKPDRKKKKKENYAIYIYKVLKQVHPDTGISSKAMNIMNCFVHDIFQRIAAESSRLSEYNKRSTIHRERYKPPSGFYGLENLLSTQLTKVQRQLLSIQITNKQKNIYFHKLKKVGPFQGHQFLSFIGTFACFPFQFF